MGVMVGPILGPTLGGWLTDSYNWRWVFFINVPVGAMAFYGIWRYIKHVQGAPDEFRHVRFRLAQFSHRRTANAAGSGEQNDWFSSLETWIEAIVMLVSFSYFLVHTMYTPANKSFVDYIC